MKKYLARLLRRQANRLDPPPLMHYTTATATTNSPIYWTTVPPR